MKFLDTNVILRYLTRDDEEKAEACYEFLQRVQRGEQELFTCESIIAEVIYVLSSPRQYGLNHQEIRERLAPILRLRHLQLPQKGVCVRALDIFGSHSTLDYENALAISHMENRNLKEIVSYDKDFDMMKEISRTEP